jgi:hypothetical protein
LGGGTQTENHVLGGDVRRKFKNGWIRFLKGERNYKMLNVLERAALYLDKGFLIS